MFLPVTILVILFGPESSETAKVLSPVQETPPLRTETEISLLHTQQPDHRPLSKAKETDLNGQPYFL
jgi:hypothetical protein